MRRSFTLCLWKSYHTCMYINIIYTLLNEIILSILVLGTPEEDNSTLISVRNMDKYHSLFIGKVWHCSSRWIVLFNCSLDGAVGRSNTMVHSCKINCPKNGCSGEIEGGKNTLYVTYQKKS